MFTIELFLLYGQLSVCLLLLFGVILGFNRRKPMIKLMRLNEIENGVVAYIVSDISGFDTIIGYVYLNENNKLRRQYCDWLN